MDSSGKKYFSKSTFGWMEARILKAERHRCITGEFSVHITSSRSITSSGSSCENATRSRKRRRKEGRGAAGKGWRVECVDETEEEVVDGGGVCRDKYLPVNTERLALPSRSIPCARRKRHA